MTMEFKTEKKTITHVNFLGAWRELRGVGTEDIDELTSHVDFFEEHICEPDDKPWTKEDIITFVDDSTTLQKKMLQTLVKFKDGIRMDTLSKELELTSAQIAGLCSGFARRHRRDFLGKADIVVAKWTDDYLNEYWIDEDCYDVVEEFFKEPTDAERAKKFFKGPAEA